MVEISVSGVTGGRWKRAVARIEAPTSSETATPRTHGTAPTRRPKRPHRLPRALPRPTGLRGEGQAVETRLRREVDPDDVLDLGLAPGAAGVGPPELEGPAPRGVE